MSVTTWSNESLTFNYYFPDYGDTFTGSPITFVADGSSHLSTLSNLSPATFSVTSIAPNEVQISYAYPAATIAVPLTSSSFNGFTISGPSGDASIIAAFVDPGSAVTGLTDAQVSFTANTVTVNLSGTSFPVGAVGLIDAQFATPEPGGLATLAVGLLLLAITGRLTKRRSSRRSSRRGQTTGTSQLAPI
jgi:hypothetical protein